MTVRLQRQHFPDLLQDANRVGIVHTLGDNFCTRPALYLVRSVGWDRFKARLFLFEPAQNLLKGGDKRRE